MSIMPSKKISLKFWIEKCLCQYVKYACESGVKIGNFMTDKFVFSRKREYKTVEFYECQRATWENRIFNLNELALATDFYS